MFHAVVGTDVYGRIKAVNRTAIVTTFSMLQLLPFKPLRSYYTWGLTEWKTTGIPLLAQERTATIRGVELARVDRISVAFAYARAAFAAMTLFGFMITLVALMSLGDKPMDNFARTLTQLAEACLVAGVAGGLLTYLIPTTGRRERAIRRACGELLGVCIDPALITPEAAAALREALPHFGESDREDATQQRSHCVRELVQTRCDVATGTGHDCEFRTDELLDQLAHLERVASI